MDCRQHWITDVFLAEWQNSCKFIAAPIKLHPKELNIRYIGEQTLQGNVAAVFYDLHGFRLFHSAVSLAGGTVKAPVAVATGRFVSASVAMARTKATDRVT